MTMSAEERVKAINAISTRQDLARYVEKIAQELPDDESWHNNDLRSFLEAMAGWIQDMDGYFMNPNEPVPLTPEWKTFAQILTAARVYS